MSPASRLCPKCGRWHDRLSYALRGWVRDYDDRWLPLPAGHMPPTYHVTGEWIPVHVPCDGLDR